MARNRPRNRSGRPGAQPGRGQRGDDAITPPARDIEEMDELLAEEATRSSVPGVLPATADVFELAAAETGADARPGTAAMSPEATERAVHGNIFARAGGFLRNCWAELQRVQWPDRQQVAQATGVVLGFVILTGVFLGVCDYVAGKLVNWIV